MPQKKKPVSSSSNESNRKKNRPVVWIIGAIALLAIFGFVCFVLMDGTKSSENSSTELISDSRENSPSADTGTIKNDPPPPAASLTGDISKMIPGSWYMVDRIIEGTSAAKTGNLVKASWIFYDDGSLKYTTGQYADLGTWTIDKKEFSASLFAQGKYKGYISEIDNKSMVWVTNEMVNGKQVSVTNHLNRVK